MVYGIQVKKGRAKSCGRNAVSATVDATDALSGFPFRPTCLNASHMEFLTLWLVDFANYINALPHQWTFDSGANHRSFPFFLPTKSFNTTVVGVSQCYSVSTLS